MKDWCRCSAGRANRSIQAGSKGIASIPELPGFVPLSLQQGVPFGYCDWVL